MNNALFRDSIHRAALAVAIVFSLAVVIAVSDPRPSASSGADDRASVSGRRFAPAPAFDTTEPPIPDAAVIIPPAPTVLSNPPTPTSEPTQTLNDVVQRIAALGGIEPAIVPADRCVSWVPLDAAVPATFRCDPGPVVSIAPGRVLLAVDDQPVLRPAAAIVEGWRWTRGQSLGNFVVVDHGPSATAASAITVYSQLSEVDPSLRRGVEVRSGQQLGVLGGSAADAGQQPSFGWEMWIDDRPPGIAEARPAATADVALFQATELAIDAHVPASCPFPAGDRTSLPNSDRSYRAGVHQGVDFVCGGAGESAFAFDDGVVTMIIDDVQEPSFDDREAILANTAIAGYTPHWILLMLYGNLVVIDHGAHENVGRVYSIYSHLASIDDAVQLGVAVAGGQRIGETGASGTSVAARDAVGAEPESIHLHWEVQIDDHYLAEGLSAAATEQIYRSLLCRADPDLDC